MSTCISQRGEYGSHELDDAYTCRWCDVVDEDAMTAELRQLREQLHTANDRANLLHDALADAARYIPGVTSALHRAQAVLRADTAGKLSPRHTDKMGRPQFCDEADADVKQLRADLAQAREAIAAVRKLHQEYEGGCLRCRCDCAADIVNRHRHIVPWPCPTICALDDAAVGVPGVVAVDSMNPGDLVIVSHGTDEHGRPAIIDAIKVTGIGATP